MPHPRLLELRQSHPPKTTDQFKTDSKINRFNSYLAVKITSGVAIMWCAYIFAIIAFISLPEAIAGGIATTIQWIAQTFLQLVLLSIIMVGQNVASKASDQRAVSTYKDAEAILSELNELREAVAKISIGPR